MVGLSAALSSSSPSRSGGARAATRSPPEIRIFVGRSGPAPTARHRLCDPNIAGAS